MDDGKSSNENISPGYQLGFGNLPDLIAVQPKSRALERNSRTIQNSVMRGVVTCLTGMRGKIFTNELIRMVQNMGGLIVRDMSAEVTHLICNKVGGAKYKYAKTFGLDVLRSDWVYEAWERRDELGFHATNVMFIAGHKLLSFEGRKICFHGFQEEELRRMEEALHCNGGMIADQDDEQCCHIVLPKGDVGKAALYELTFCVEPPTEDPIQCDDLYPFYLTDEDICGGASPSTDAGSRCDLKTTSPKRKRKYDDQSQAGGDNQISELNKSFLQRTLKKIQSKFKPTKRSKGSKKSVRQTSTEDFVDLVQIDKKFPSTVVGPESPQERSTLSIKSKPDTPRPTRNTFLEPLPPTPATSSTSSDDKAATIGDTFLMPLAEPKRSSTPVKRRSDVITVNEDWFWQAITNGFADEQDFLVSIEDEQDNKSFNGTFLVPKTTPKSGVVKSTGLFQVSRSSSMSSVEQSMRYIHFSELLTTESNFVGVLDEIVNNLKGELEELATTDRPLLQTDEIEEIFAHLSPIFHVHTKILGRLTELNDAWTEESAIGKVILDYYTDLVEAYPPYLNNFEGTLKALKRCDSENPRFHAFLNIYEGRSCFGGQPLKDIMMYPVQRLPRIELVLKEIWKHTSICSEDYKPLEEAIAAMRSILTHLNCDRLRSQTLHDIFGSIEDCPFIISDKQRRMMLRCEVKEIGTNLAERDTPLVLFTFTDMIIICKKRSPHAFGSQKTLKYLHHFGLLDIRWIVDIKDKVGFSLVLRTYEKYAFFITDCDVDKLSYLQLLTKTYSKLTGCTTLNEFFQQRKMRNLDVDYDPNKSALNRLAAKTCSKLKHSFQSKSSK